MGRPRATLNERIAIRALRAARYGALVLAAGATIFAALDTAALLDDGQSGRLGAVWARTFAIYAVAIVLFALGWTVGRRMERILSFE